MSGRTDPGRPVHIDSQIPATFDAGLARVQTHPHPQQDTLRPGVPSQQPLRRNRRRGPVLRPLKGREELISPALHLVPTRIRHRFSKQPPVLFPHRTEVFSEPMHKRRRPFDIREEQRHRAGRQPSHPNARV